MIIFEEVSTLGRGDYVKVKKLVRLGENHSLYHKLNGKMIPIDIGWIDKCADGYYRYYKTITNES